MQAPPRPPQGHIKATSRLVDSQAIGTPKPPQGYLKATTRLPQGHLKASLKPGTGGQAFGGPFMNGVNRSIGTGRKVVVLCSLEISRMV